MLNVTFAACQISASLEKGGLEPGGLVIKGWVPIQPLQEPVAIQNPYL